MPQSDETKKLGRPANKRSEIVKGLRSAVVKGKWQPDEKLPTRHDFCRNYQASLATVQHALAQLEREGFVESRSYGTFISKNPPHLNHYVVVFRFSPGDVDYPRFGYALAQAATELQSTGIGRISILHGIDGRPDNEDRLRLEEQIKSHCVAGLVLSAYGSLPHLIPLAERHGIPMVILDQPRFDIPYGMGHAWLDFRDFCKKAIAHLKAEGCRTIGCLAPHGSLAWNQIDFEKECSDQELVTYPYLIQSTSMTQKNDVRNLMHLWMRLPENRPDGLVIFDDNLVEAAAEGITDAMPNPSGQLKIVAHTNFLAPVPNFLAPMRSLVPIKWLGFDDKELLLGAINYLKKKARKITALDNIPIPAEFAEDYESRVHRGRE